jgi:hypothetical protein
LPGLRRQKLEPE